MKIYSTQQILPVSMFCSEKRERRETTPKKGEIIRLGRFIHSQKNMEREVRIAE
jgi:hypothetical protein